MARVSDLQVPQFDVPLAPLPSPGTARADVLGAGVAAGQSVVEALDKRERIDGQLNAALKLAAWKRKRNDAMFDDYKNGRIPEGYTQQQLDATDEEARQMLATADGPTEQRMLQLGIADQGGEFHHQAIQYEAEANTARQAGKALEHRTELLNGISKGITTPERAMQEFGASIDTAGNMTVPESVKAKTDFQTDAVKAAIMRLPYDQAVQELEDGKYDKLLDPDTKRTFIDYLRRRRNDAFTKEHDDYEREQMQRKQASEDIERTVTGFKLKQDYAGAKKYYLENRDRMTSEADARVGKSLNQPTSASPGNPASYVRLYRGATLGDQSALEEAEKLADSGELSADEANRITDAYRHANGSPPYIRAQQQIQLNFRNLGSAVADPLAESHALQQFDNWWTNEQKATGTSPSVPFTNTMIAQLMDRWTGEPSKPHDPVIKGGAVDIQATQQKVWKKFLDQHNGDADEAAKDPLFLAEKKRIADYKRWQDGKEATDAMTRGLGTEE